jgi:hypothetical protein
MAVPQLTQGISSMIEPRYFRNLRPRDAWSGGLETKSFHQSPGDSLASIVIAFRRGHFLFHPKRSRRARLSKIAVVSGT